VLLSSMTSTLAPPPAAAAEASISK